MNRPFVLDFGTVTFRVGRAGDKDPLLSVPPFFGRVLLDGDQGGDFGADWLNYAVFPLSQRTKHDNTVPTPIVKYVNNNFDIDFEMLEKFLEGCEGSRGISETFQESSMIVSEPNLQNDKFRRIFTEVLVEKFKVDRLLLCKRAPLSCYASARTSGIVVDVGGSCSNVAAVSEGFVIQSSIQQEPVGGILLDRTFLKYLEHNQVTIRPCFEYYKTQQGDKKTVNTREMPYVHESYYDWCRLYATSRLKETCIVANSNLNMDLDVPETDFALPDGSYLYTHTCKALCGLACAVLFNDKSLLQDPEHLNAIAKEPLCNYYQGTSVTLDSILSGSSGLGNLLNKCMKSLNPETVHCDTKSTIILSGGTTRHPAVAPLLQKALDKQDFDELINIGGIEQQNSSFIGASILASLGGFDTYSISRREIQEHGIHVILQRKCP
ncbi:bifunctional ATPase [Babesia duncani]|uniref:Bifunctional ATPase n=1 Tax=Babesia duncani TaxID=323732 RepID=A0AAD9PND5_9APIC|nr:bifunctional ATPase [Babesia duncani]